jgi:putative ABC transport system ATP-binding protein
MGEPLLQAVGLWKSYRAGETTVRAVSGISLDVEEGEFLAIIGRSGSGKSTLLHILGLLARPDTGQYSLRGRRVENLGEDARADIRNREIGFVFQLSALLPRATALENVALPLAYAGIGRKERRRRAKDALEQVGLLHRASHWPHQLSGGEQQRVAIARAIVGRPALILADEPTGALDSVTSNEILSLFTDLNEGGHTVVVATHDADIAGRAHRRITLHDGCIVDDVGASACPKNPMAVAARALP